MRTQEKIIVDILRTARTNSTKTRIVYSTNLNFKVFKKYAEHLLVHGLLQKIENKFKTTEKGLRFIEHHRELELLLTMNGES